MKLLEMTSHLKGKVISEVFFNDNDWVIKFEDGTAITLGLEEYKKKVVVLLNESNYVLMIEKEESK